MGDENKKTCAHIEREEIKYEKEWFTTTHNGDLFHTLKLLLIFLGQSTSIENTLGKVLLHMA